MSGLGLHWRWGGLENWWGLSGLGLWFRLAGLRIGFGFLRLYDVDALDGLTSTTDEFLFDSLGCAAEDYNGNRVILLIVHLVSNFLVST